MSLISSMLNSERDARPTATQVKDQLSAIALEIFQPRKITCRACKKAFPDHAGLLQHLKETGHKRKFVAKETHLDHEQNIPEDETGLTIRGIADAPVNYHYDDTELDAIDPSPCLVCDTHFDTKRDFFRHLYGVHHYRGLKYVLKRRAESSLDANVDKEDERQAKRIWKDMPRHTD
jgi:hypothetical protein